jgi:hypothetical protein
MEVMQNLQENPEALITERVNILLTRLPLLLDILRSNDHDLALTICRHTDSATPKSSRLTAEVLRKYADRDSPPLNVDRNRRV